MALFDIANYPADAQTIIRAVLPIVVVRQMVDHNMGVCRDHLPQSLLPEEAVPLRQFVIASLDKIASGDRNPHTLRRAFDRWFQNAARPQKNLRDVIHSCGHHGVRHEMALSEVVFDEVIRLARSDFHVARCELEECRHFFLPDSQIARACSRSCRNRLGYLRRTTPQTVPAGKAARRAATV